MCVCEGSSFLQSCDLQSFAAASVVAASLCGYNPVNLV